MALTEKFRRLDDQVLGSPRVGQGERWEHTREGSADSGRGKDWIAAVVWLALFNATLRLMGVYSTETAVTAFFGEAIGIAIVLGIGVRALRSGLPAGQLAPWLPPTNGLPEGRPQPAEDIPDPVITPDIVRRAAILKWSLRVLAIPFLPMIGTRKLLDKIG